MLQSLPTHLFCGPLGAGKTSLLRSLLAQKPSSERWAVLVNEFGEIGLDAALLAQNRQGLVLQELVGGCVCCTQGAPFQVVLSQLLRQARPDRLFIELSGLGHPRQLLQQLQQPPWQDVLELHPLVLVVDARHGPQSLPEGLAGLLETAGLVLLNKTEALSAEVRLHWQQRLGHRPHYWTQRGQLPLAQLPGFQPVQSASNPALTLVPADPVTTISQGLTPRLQSHVRRVMHQEHEAWSVGWQWPPRDCFDMEQLTTTLADWSWIRAKGVLHGMQGWYSLNAVAPERQWEWQASEWRRDSRLELIFMTPQSSEDLEQALLNCQLPT